MVTYGFWRLNEELVPDQCQPQSLLQQKQYPSVKTSGAEINHWYREFYKRISNTHKHMNNINLIFNMFGGIILNCLFIETQNY